MRIAILGASKIGKFHAREFNRLGCDVSAILGSTDSTAQETSYMLKKEFGIEARPYSNIDTLLSSESLNAVSICTPPYLHQSFSRACLNRGINTLCEKPLALSPDSYSVVEGLCSLADSRAAIFAINTQFPSLLKYVEIPNKIDSFSVDMESGETGISMLYDFLPHANSLLVKLVKGSPRNIVFDSTDKNNISLTFDYLADSKCQVHYHFRNKSTRPRKLSFTINGFEYTRKVENDYSQKLCARHRISNIEDPLSVSIYAFIQSISGEKPLNSREDILNSASLQDRIISVYSAL